MSYTAFNEEILTLVILGACPPFSNAKDTVRLGMSIIYLWVLMG
jgi:hypothetical protein